MIPLSFLQYVYPFHHGRKKLLGLLRRTCGRITMTRSVFGDYMLIDRFNYVDHQVLLHGGYETEQIRNFLNKIEQISAEIFIDIGANLGVYCLPARRLKCLEKVIAFEPDDRNFKQLSGNIFLNDHNGKIEARMEAVGDRNGMVDFFVQRSDKDFVTAHSGLSNQGEGFWRVSVPMVRLDDRLDYSGRTICIKIDVEGHESTAIKGMEQLLKNNRILIQVEIFDEQFEAVDRQLQNIGLKMNEKVEASVNDYIYSNFDFPGPALSH